MELQGAGSACFFDRKGRSKEALSARFDKREGPAEALPDSFDKKEES